MKKKKRKIKYAAIFFLCWFSILVLLVDGIVGFQTLKSDRSHVVL